MMLWLLLLLSLFQVRSDPAWDAAFQRDQGWNGADGAYSVALPNGEVGWLFSDTFVGPVSANGERLHNQFWHNSWARMRGPQMLEFGPLTHHFDWVYQPYLDAQGKGFVFLGRFEECEGPAGLNFRQADNLLAELDWSAGAPKLGKILSVPHFQKKPPLNWGAAILPWGQDLFVYATRDFGVRKEICLAKVSGTQLDQFENWSLFEDPILPEGSNEFSVYPYAGEVRLLVQVGQEIRLYRALNPEGPYDQHVVLYQIPSDGNWSYNAKAHPELGWPLLITYNRNAFPPEKVIQQADLYRPRCLRLDRDPWL
jgi:hypothetical protein